MHPKQFKNRLRKLKDFYIQKNKLIAIVIKCYGKNSWRYQRELHNRINDKSWRI